MSSIREKLLARINWYRQYSLKYITDYITGNEFYYRGGRYRPGECIIKTSVDFLNFLEGWVLYFFQIPLKFVSKNLWCRTDYHTQKYDRL